MDAAGSELINQTIVARRLGLSVPETLALLAERQYWDQQKRRASERAVAEGLAKTVEHPLSGAVSLWSPRIVELLAPEGSTVPTRVGADPDTGVPAGPGRPSGSSAPAGARQQMPAGAGQQQVAASAKPFGDPHPSAKPVGEPQPSGSPVVAASSSVPEGAPRGGRVIEVFLASSIEEFGAERSQIAGILHSVDHQFSAYLAEYDPDGDSQELINHHITSASYFIAIIGRKLGVKTALEIDLAIKLNQAAGSPRIKFFVQKFADDQAQRSAEVDAFVKRLYEDGVYYPREFADSQELIDQVELFFRRLKR